MGTIAKGPAGAEDINWKTSGTTRQTFLRNDSTGRLLTLNKPDAADMQFRTLALSIDDLVDGGYDVEIKPKSIHGGANNTTGHVMPDVADDVIKYYRGGVQKAERELYAKIQGKRKKKV